MKKLTSVALLLLTGLAFIHAADKYAPAGNTLADALQWLAVQTACLGEYSMAFTGDFTQSDPRDNYRPNDIREYLARQSGNRTSIRTIYGICFDYAQYAYNIISDSRSYYTGLGVRQWYIAGTHGNSRQMVLYDPVPRGQHDLEQNGVYVKVASRPNVQAHNDITYHAWLWVIGNDGTTYWIDPTWTDNTGYVWWGVVRNGREEQVAPATRLCAERIPAGIAFASFTSGDANRSAGRYTEAIEEYDEAIRVEPNYAQIYNNRGLAYYQKGDYDRAIADFNQAITLDPNYADAYNNRGRTYYAKGDLDRSLTDYNQAITLDPEFHLAYHGRAQVYMAKTDYTKAYTDMRRAGSLFPREAVYIVTQGEILIAMKEFKRAVTILEAALLINPNVPNGRELLERAKRGR
ncbi:MAG: tetratricopeptide repeat protein [Treponema sp.]|jgi:tetratricopeptide (TPR) repeat protein|nr:tetratricopeptide repeat protein [Treponema sp.]